MLITIKYFFPLLTIVALSVFKPNSTNAQTTLTWKDFDKITYVEKWDTTFKINHLVPVFDNELKNFEGKKIIISGYLFSFDILNDYYMLKSNEQDICIGCDYSNTNTNTDVIIELNFKKTDSTYLKQFNNKKVTIKGVLKLNDSDILQWSLIIESAEIVK